MELRLNTLPIHLATKLIPYNISRLPGYVRFDPASSGAGELEQVLRATGISPEAAHCAVNGREHFCESVDALPYLNASVIVAGETNLSTPTLVGYMLDECRRWSAPVQILELGVGTGFHLAATAALHPGAHLVGVDISYEVCNQARERLADLSSARRVDVVCSMEAAQVVASASHVYSTCAMSLEQLSFVTAVSSIGSTWLVPRQLTAFEFHSEPSTSWLRRKFESYQSYCSSPGWNAFCVIDHFVITPDRKRSTVSSLFDVYFVPMRGVEQAGIH